MSIDIDEFEQSSEDELDDKSNPEQVLEFLAQRDDQAFKPAEIADRIGIKKNSIGTVLSRLEDRNLVRHKGPYYAITDDTDRLANLHRYQATTSALNDSLGEEDPAEWADHAADEYPEEKREDTA